VGVRGRFSNNMLKQNNCACARAPQGLPSTPHRGCCYCYWPGCIASADWNHLGLEYFASYDSVCGAASWPCALMAVVGSWGGGGGGGYDVPREGGGIWSAGQSHDRQTQAEELISTGESEEETNDLASTVYEVKRKLLKCNTTTDSDAG
jgi:hypothetical protein